MRRWWGHWVKFLFVAGYCLSVKERESISLYATLFRIHPDKPTNARTSASAGLSCPNLVHYVRIHVTHVELSRQISKWFVYSTYRLTLCAQTTMSNVSVLGEAPPPPKFNLYDLEIVCLGTTGTAKALDKDRVIKSYHPNEEEVAQVEQNIYKRLGAHPRHTKLP